MSEHDNASPSVPVATVASLLVILVLLIGSHFRLWKTQPDPTAIQNTAIAFMGVLLDWLLSLVRRRNTRPPKDEEAEEPQVPPVSGDNAVSEWVRKYNYVVQRHNRVVESRKRWIKYADDEHARAELLRLNSRAFRVAVYFAVWCALIAIVCPLPNREDIYNRKNVGARYEQVSLLMLGAIVVPSSLVVEAARSGAFPPFIIAARIALFGIFGCGIINLSISLPYRQEELRGHYDPMFHANYLAVAILLRLLILPVIACIAAYITAYVIHIRKKPNK